MAFEERTGVRRTNRFEFLRDVHGLQRDPLVARGVPLKNYIIRLFQVGPHFRHQVPSYEPLVFWEIESDRGEAEDISV